MSRRAILVVEDDRPIRRGIVDALDYHGYDVLEAEDGDNGLDLATQAECDLILLDLVLPGPDGLEILREVRASRPTLPVIILTARGEEDDRVEGLKLGADDYVVKPFSVNELLARIEAVLRRSAERPTDVSEVAFDGGTAFLELGEVVYDGRARAELCGRQGELLP
ncbi:MAG: response regulator, partial [Planctomycetota bacterium]